MDSGVFDDEVVSMIDVLHEDDELEAEAEAVLGGSDDQHCTYQTGYVMRQALYACATCTPPTSESAGVCLACSLHCHEGHELYELYTKRNFRCDCGNELFGEFQCKLNPEKDPKNDKNQYNQNFKGVYCTCKRPYPDPDDEIEDEMIQCIVCEDWYHSRHLGQLPPAEYQEMICDQCMSQYTFIQAYLSIAVPGHSVIPGPPAQVITNADSNKTVDVCSVEADSSTGKLGPEQGTSGTSKPDKSEAEAKPTNGEANTSDSKQQPEEPSVSSSRTPPEKKNTEDSKEMTDKAEPSTSSDGVCKFEALQACVESVSNVAAYFCTGWRAQLCSCQSCKAMYKKLNVSFLLDETDTVLAYEERGVRSKEERGNVYDEGIKLVNQMDRVNQVEVIHEYNNMKSELTEYLRQFADQGKVVTSEDITEFFENMRERKRQRVGDEKSMQYFCR